MGKSLLVLDIDETLIHAIEHKDIETKRSEGVDVDNPDFETLDIYPTFERPYLYDFLEYALANFEVGIWTTAGNLYADSVIENIFTKYNLPKPLFVYSIRNCVRRREYDYTYGYGATYSYIKDLTKLKKFGYPLNTTLIVDDSPEKITRQYGNYIPIKPFEGNKDDYELKRLMLYLEDLKQYDTVRNIEKRGWENHYDIQE